MIYSYNAVKRHIYIRVAVEKIINEFMLLSKLIRQAVFVEGNSIWYNDVVFKPRPHYNPIKMLIIYDT